MTPDQIFESFRKASASSFQMQQELLKQLMQQWPWPAGAAGGSEDWLRRFQKRWMDFAAESLDKHRESLDAMYKAAIQLLAQASHLYESKNPDEYRRGMEEIGGRMFETFKEQSEAQMREWQKAAERWFDMVTKG